MNLQRVSKKEPCAACGKDSWCLFSDTSALCMRVQSNRPLVMRNGDMGWWHDSGVTPRPQKSKPIKESTTIDAAGMMGQWRRSTLKTWIAKMSDSIGVDCASVMRLNPAWAPDWNAWAWPMSNGNGKVCGIRLRTDSGRKFAVTGSQQGLFVPAAEPANRVFLVEGPTDTAALLSLGVYAIGRPSASGGMMEIKQTIARLRIREVVIIADNDQDKEHNGRKFNPGYDGARALQNHLMVPSCIISLPTKDAREFLMEGGTREMLESFVNQTVWQTNG
jgi:hypothetical protein